MLSMKAACRAFFVAENCDRQTGQRDSETRAGRLGHLSADQRGFGLCRIAGLDDAGLGHFQQIAFSASVRRRRRTRNIRRVAWRRC